MKVRRVAKVLAYLGGAVAALLLLVIAAAVVILPSTWFREKVRARIVTEVERASGGRVAVGSFRFDWTTLSAEVAPFVLHGTEPAGQPPLFSADTVRVGLKIISVFARDVDIAAVDVIQPQVNILIDQNGITNFPKPKVRRTSATDPIEQLLRLKIGEIRLRNGELRYGDRRLPLELHGRYLTAKLAYDFEGPSYQGEVAIRELMIDAAAALPMTFAFDSRIGLYKNRVGVHHARLGMRETTVDVSGSVEDFKAPRIALDVRGTGALSEIGKPLKLPVEPTGQVSFTGQFLWDRPGGIRIQGRTTGQHLAYRQGRVSLRDISLASDLKYENNDVHLRGLTVHALDGVFTGSADIADHRTFQIDGKLTGVSVRSVARMTGNEQFGLSGTLNGPVEVSGSFRTNRDVRATGSFEVAASQGDLPVRGSVEAAWNGRTQTLRLGDSNLHLPSTSVQFHGTLGEKLDINLESKNLDEIRAVAGLDKLPLELRKDGSAMFRGAVTGPVQSARVAGTVTLTGFRAQNQTVDRLVATIDATSSHVSVKSFALGQDTLRLAGAVEIELKDWRASDSSAISGSTTATNARIAKLLADFGQKLPLEGLADATVQVSGTIGEPKLSADLTVDNPRIYGESFDRLRAKLDYAISGVQVIEAVAQAGPSRVRLSGTWRHPVGDWKNGTVNFNIATENWTLAQLESLRRMQAEIAGRVAVQGSGTVAVRDGQLLPESLDGVITVTQLGVDGRALGDFTIDAKTVGRELAVGMSGVLRGSKVSGNGTFELAGDYPGKGTVEFSPMTLATLQDLLRATSDGEPMPVDGFLSGRISFSGPVRKPELMKARIELPVLEIAPARQTMTARQRQELMLRNDGTLVAEYDGKAVTIRNAHLLGRETDLRIGGSVLLDPKTAYDLRIDGNLNLGVLQNFNEDIVSSGVAVLNGAVKGNLREPDLSGRMEFRNASFYLTDFPNGLDNVSGVILFDQRRANIERLRATTGGGDLAVTGFVGFASREWLYQLQARAESVRIRYPEGVSTTSNATLTLTGTTSKSLLTGVVTVVRASFNPRTDIASILASAPVPTASPASQNPILRGMQFDIRLETVPNLQFQTALTSDLQVEAELRARGSAAKPVVLGRMVISQGEIQFFGNRYSIARGEIGFYNPVRIEPVLDFDLETRVRGVLVNISFAGPLNKLNVSYRSDPPLQSNDIVALLAIGRAPGSNSSLASSQTVSNQTFLGGGGNSLLGQAVAAPISSRLQRFFGVSRLKIDPQLTGLSAVPQARLTVEQQISRDVTLTYVTNLSQANQQIIRLEWDLSRTWSVVAVREENGVFGVDFFFKKRF